MSTPITTDRLRISAELHDGRTIARELGGGELLRARVLASAGPGLRVAIVQTAACLLAGDEVAIELVAAPGTEIEIVETAATVAHDARGGARARWAVDVRVGAEARVRWLGAPFIVAAGAVVDRTLDFALEAGGAALLRDTVVFGRAGGPAGALRSASVARYAGAPLLVEALDTAESHALRSPVVVGAAKVLDTVALLGLRPPALPPGACALHGPGALLAVPAASHHEAEAATARVRADWSACLSAERELARA